MEKYRLELRRQRKEDEKYRPIAMIQREEHDGTRRYYIEREVIRMEGEKVEKSIPREDFATVADLILDAIKNSSADEVTSPDGVEEFLDEAGIFDLEARTEGHYRLSRLLSGILRLRWRVSMSVRVSVR